jgi:hypothetical protein
LVILMALVAAGCASATAGPSGHPNGPAPAGRTALLAHLGILRRPAAKTDSSPALAATLKQFAHVGCDSLIVDPGLTRLAMVARDGTPVYVVVFKPASCVPHCTGTARMCIRALPRVETVAVLAGSHEFPQIATFPEVETGAAVAIDHALRFVLVPDGVVRVAVQVTSSGRPFETAAPVRNNLAVLHVHRPATMLWLNAGGRIVRRAPIY